MLPRSVLLNHWGFGMSNVGSFDVVLHCPVIASCSSIWHAHLHKHNICMRRCTCGSEILLLGLYIFLGRW